MFCYNGQRLTMFVLGMFASRRCARRAWTPRRRCART